MSIVDLHSGLDGKHARLQLFKIGSGKQASEIYRISNLETIRMYIEIFNIFILR
jgi:hypothetical protein